MRENPDRPNTYNAEKITTLDEYARALAISALSVQSMEKYQHTAYKNGLLDDDMAELSKTICWELKRLLGLIKTQLENVLDVVDETESSIIDQIVDKNDDHKDI